MLMVYDKIYKALRLLNKDKIYREKKLDMAMITFVTIIFAKASIYFNVDAQCLFSSPSLSYHLQNPSHKISKVKKRQQPMKIFHNHNILLFFIFFLDGQALNKNLKCLNTKQYSFKEGCDVSFVYSLYQFSAVFAQLNTFQHNSPSAPFIGRPNTCRVCKTKLATKMYFLEVTGLIKSFY